MSQFKTIFSALEKQKNKEKAEKMGAYMLHQFEFLGIQSPERRALTKPFFAEMKKEQKIDWHFVKACWASPYRELQYVATDYLKLQKKHLTLGDVSALKELVIIKSWWDSVDNLHALFGEMALRESSLEKILLEWSLHDNFWLRRIAIDHQLLRKEKMNTELLEKIIVNNFGQTEFFINKAIGWALRDYSKTNPLWVKDFIQKYHTQMAKLSIREASKYLNG